LSSGRDDLRAARGKDLRKTKRPPDPEAKDVNPVRRGPPEAVGRTEARGNVDPGTAADDMGLTIAICPGLAVHGCPVVVLAIAILHPLPHVAGHVVEAERIGLERSNR